MTLQTASSPPCERTYLKLRHDIDILPIKTAAPSRDFAHQLGLMDNKTPDVGNRNRFRRSDWHCTCCITAKEPPTSHQSGMVRLEGHTGSAKASSHSVNAILA